MQFGFFSPDNSSDVATVLLTLGGKLGAQGMRVAGGATDTIHDPAVRKLRMDLVLFPSGTRHCISQDLGRLASGCSLDPGALETAAGLTYAQLQQGCADILICKYGKQEAAARGFAASIALGLELGLPVICGVSLAQKSAFERFSAGLAQKLPPHAVDLASWALGARAAMS